MAKPKLSACKQGNKTGRSSSGASFEGGRAGSSAGIAQRGFTSAGEVLNRFIL